MKLSLSLKKKKAPDQANPAEKPKAVEPKVEPAKAKKEKPKKEKKEKKAKGAAGGPRLGLILALLIISVATMFGLYTYVATQEGYDREFLSLLADQRVLSQQMTAQASQVNRGSPEYFDVLQRQHDVFAKNLNLLKDGDPDSGMPPAPVAVAEALGALSSHWSKYNDNIQTVLNSRDLIIALRQIVKIVNQNSAGLLAITDEVATLMAQKGAKNDQVYIASRQLMLVQRIINNVNRVVEGGEGAVTAADRFGRDAALYGRVINAFLDGDRALGIDAVKDSDLVEKVEETADFFDQIGKQVSGILERSPEMFQASEAVQGVVLQSGQLLDDVDDLEVSYRAFIKERAIFNTLANAFGIAALLLLIYLGMQLKRDTEARLVATEAQRQSTEEQNRRNQQAIMRLLDEMGDLADGDLTVNATVTEDITGAIADSMNYAIDALRNLVTAINRTAEQVSSAAQQSQATAVHLAKSSDHQAQQITSASTAINEMAISIEGVSENADQLAQEAQRSVDIAKKGTDTVRRTIEGMNTIREQIQETSKRIKRLGESSQEIGDIVGLINDIAEQTNILALNAAIQAAMAGEAGRGFAVVADEVQRLAERSADATKQIEALVKTIQTDTNEAVISMEQSTSGVVAGARLAEDAGTALVEIESVATHLADLVQSISDATRQQATAAANISDTMNVIQEITTQTSEGTNQTAQSIGELATLADDLKHSVSGFKLPG